MSSPDLVTVFSEGKFSCQAPLNNFSKMALDQAHEQLNKKVKGVGGLVGFFNSENALKRWLFAGPLVMDVIDEIKRDISHYIFT